MIANRLLLIISLCSIFGFAQDKNTDAYFMLNSSDSNYVLKSEGGKLDTAKCSLKITRFNIYDRILSKTNTDKAVMNRVFK